MGKLEMIDQAGATVRGCRPKPATAHLGLANRERWRAGAVAAMAGAVLVSLFVAPGAFASGGPRRVPSAKRLWRHVSADERVTATPIKHLVVVFQENGPSIGTSGHILTR